MLKFRGKKEVVSSEGCWSYGSKDIYTEEYTDENKNIYSINVERYFDDNGKYKENIFFDTLCPNNQNNIFTTLQKELIKLRIRKALKFMGTQFRECDGPLYPEHNFDPNSKTVDFNALALEKTDIFSTQEEYQKCKEYIELQIKRKFFETIDIEVDKNNIDKADDEWFRFRVIEKYWRLKEPDNNSNGFCEVYYRIEYYNK